METDCAFCGKYVKVKDREINKQGELLHADSRLCLEK